MRPGSLLFLHGLQLHDKVLPLMSPQVRLKKTSCIQSWRFAASPSTHLTGGHWEADQEENSSKNEGDGLDGASAKQCQHEGASHLRHQVCCPEEQLHQKDVEAKHREVHGQAKERHVN